MKFFEKLTPQPKDVQPKVYETITRCYFSEMDQENLFKYCLRIEPFNKPTKLHIKDGKIYGNGYYLGTLDPVDGKYIIQHLNEIEKLSILSPCVQASFHQEIR